MGILPRLAAAAALGAACSTLSAPSARAALPERVGACVATSIIQIGTHSAPALPGVLVRPASATRDAGRAASKAAGKPAGQAPDRTVGHAVGYANAGSQVSTSKLPEIARSLVDDRVQMCLVAADQACPRGDLGARLYRVTNERTRETWTLPDSPSRCTAP